jgi:hypothetical protein
MVNTDFPFVPSYLISLVWWGRGYGRRDLLLITGYDGHKLTLAPPRPSQCSHMDAAAKTCTPQKTKAGSGNIQNDVSFLLDLVGVPSLQRLSILSV